MEERTAVIPLLDRASALADKSDVSEDYALMRILKPGDGNEWSPGREIDSDYVVALNDSILRTIADIKNRSHRTKPASSGIWFWLDQRGITKWIVIAVIVVSIPTSMAASCSNSR